ncbi:unnamed protein product [Fraxinus pennsylvanica]|uniref:Lipoprotein n=1 Tax=Fraxinus pennsylvanica TaxID=56036 RepID=A0AAD1ZRB0_9LAMI|nr:unnamed protein product [Fraxinus pennsylvanica]
MSSNSKLKLFFFFSSFSLLSLSCSSQLLSTNTTPTVYEILEKFGLPSGLLPDSVTSYTLSDDGKFVVNLKKACYIQFDYLVYYEKKITGKLSVGSISNLKGIQVKRFFLWFDVDKIKVDSPPSDSIYFTVGIINKELDVDQFLTVRSCKDKALSALPCGGGADGSGRQSLKKIFQLPTPVDDIPMLITE